MGLKEKLTRLREDAVDRDPAARITRWTVAVAELYADIERWLSEYAADGLMVSRRETITVEESPVGTYGIERLEFDLPAGRTLVFNPVGLDVIAADGRVDVYVQGALSEGASLILNARPGAVLRSLAGLPPSSPLGWVLRRKLPSTFGNRIGALTGLVQEEEVPLTQENLESTIEALLG